MDSPERSPPAARKGAGRMCVRPQPRKSPRHRTKKPGKRVRGLEKTMVGRLLSVASSDAEKGLPRTAAAFCDGSPRASSPTRPGDVLMLCCSWIIGLAFVGQVPAPSSGLDQTAKLKAMARAIEARETRDLDAFASDLASQGNARAAVE